MARHPQIDPVKVRKRCKKNACAALFGVARPDIGALVATDCRQRDECIEGFEILARQLPAPLSGGLDDGVHEWTASQRVAACGDDALKRFCERGLTEERAFGERCTAAEVYGTEGVVQAAMIGMGPAQRMGESGTHSESVARERDRRRPDDGTR